MKNLFYSKCTFSETSILWLEQTSKALGVHIHHALCGHGGERWIKGAFVDGYEPKSKTVFQFHGCHFHGCKKCFPNGRQKVVTNGKTCNKARTATAKRTQALREAGFQVIEKWECQFQKMREPLPEKRMRPYPHAIFYDFEAYQDKSQRQQPTADLAYENVHVLISVSLGDTLDNTLTHLCDFDPNRLVCRFMEELERRGAKIRARIRGEFAPEDLVLLQGKQRRKLEGWCDQVPVLGFNCRRYDLKLIKEHFAKLLADTTAKVQVGKKANRRILIPGHHQLPRPWHVI